MQEKNRLLEFKLFDGLNPDDGNKVISISLEEKYNNEEIIFEDSLQHFDLFIVLDGMVNVEIEVSPFDGESKKRIHITTLRSGDVFGEIAFLEGRRRSASVKAAGKVAVLRINGQKLFEIFEQNKNIGYVMMKNLAGILAQRLVDTNFKFRNEITSILP